MVFTVTEDNSNVAYSLAKKYANQYKDWRWGQCVFNAYYTGFPEETNKIRGTDNDCFYNDNKVPNFLKCFNVISN